jgi:hypothetical protein
MKFKYFLAEALREHSPGAIATALEENGCFGYDRFGRVIHLTDDLVEPVLTTVADFYRENLEWIMDDNNFDPETWSVRSSPSEEMIESPNDSCFWQYGWVSDKDIPIFTDSIPLREKSSIDKPLGTQERNKLYQMLIAMAIDGYGYDVEAKTSPIPSQLASMFKDRFNFNYTSESISNHLKIARKLIEI